LDIDEDKLFDCFKFKNDRIRERMQRGFRNKAVAINALRDTPISISEAIKAFYDGFQKGLNIELVPFELSEEQEAYVNDLAMDKYASNEWNFSK
ncbi:octanoyltransferase, partial [Planococcus sp. SIMBA_143]